MAAPAMYPLRQFQLGKESAAGTAVAATWFMVGETVASPDIPRYMSDYPRGVMVPVTGGGVPLYQTTKFVQTVELTYEELWYHCMLGMATATVAGGGADKTWTFAPVITGNPAIQTATAEWALSDGSATAFPYPGATGDPLTMQTPYVYSNGWDIQADFNQIAKFVGRLEGRATAYGVAGVPTAALTPLTGRERIPSNLFKLYLDTTFAGLGGTPLNTVLRKLKMTFVPGIMPDFTLDGRAAMDFTQLVWAMDRYITLQLVLEVDATSALEIKAWVAQNAGGGALNPNVASGGTVALRFIRVEATSPNTLGGSNRRLRIDGAYIYTKAPVFSIENKAEVVTLELKTEYDPVSAKSFQAAIVHSLATFT